MVKSISKVSELGEPLGFSKKELSEIKFGTKARKSAIESFDEAFLCLEVAGSTYFLPLFFPIIP